MRLLVLAVLVGLFFVSFALAEEIKPEIRIFPNGDILLVGAELFRKHASNLYTVRGWNMKWVVPFDPAATNASFESAYGAKINPAEIQEGHLMEIKGKLAWDKNALAYQIEPSLIRDLSIKIGEPQTQPSPPPTPLGVVAPTLEAKPQVVGAPTPNPSLPTSKLKLTMTLKPGFWGGQVKILQDFLKKQGYFPKSEPASRYFGPATKKALADFQKANALEATGALGPKTRALINSLLNQ